MHSNSAEVVAEACVAFSRVCREYQYGMGSRLVLRRFGSSTILVIVHSPTPTFFLRVWLTLGLCEPLCLLYASQIDPGYSYFCYRIAARNI